MVYRPLNAVVGEIVKSVDTALETVGGMLRRETETEKVKKKSCRFYISPEAEINSQIINHRIKKKNKKPLTRFEYLHQFDR